MRILYHHRTLAEDAQGVHIEEMIRALRREGNTVREASLVARDEQPSAPRGPTRWRRVARLARGPLYEILEYVYNLPAYRKLVREMRAFRPHLVYERYSLSTFAGILAARKIEVPHLLEVNSPMVLERRRWERLWFGALALRVERWIFRNTDRVLVVSSVLGEILEREGVRPERIRVVPNGVDERSFHAGVSGAEVRSRFELEGKTVLGFSGWFRQWHGLDQVVRELSSPALRDLPLHLLLVGDGPARVGIESIARACGVADRVTVTGPVSRRELPAHVACFDVALQPAATEYACPMKIPEYLALGKPIIAPDQKNIRELVEDGREGILFRRDREGSLAEAILRLVEDPDLRMRLGQGAAKRVIRDGLLWTNNARRVAGLAREIRERELGGR